MDKYGESTSSSPSPSALLVVRNKNKRMGRLRKEMKRLAKKKSNKRLQKEIATMQDLINNEFIRVGLHTHSDGVIVAGDGDGEEGTCDTPRGVCDAAAEAHDEHVTYEDDENDDTGTTACNETEDCDHDDDSSQAVAVVEDDEEDDEEEEEEALSHEEELAILTKMLADKELESRTYKHQLEASQTEVQVLREKLKDNRELVETQEELTKAIDMLSTFKILSGVQIGNKDEQINLLRCQLQNQRDLCQIKDEKIVALYNDRETLTRNHRAAIFVCQDIMTSMVQEHGIILERTADVSGFEFPSAGDVASATCTTTPIKAMMRSIAPNIVSP